MLRAILLVMLSVGSVCASVIDIASQGTLLDSMQFSSRGPTKPIDPDPFWNSPIQGSSWVSYTNSGNHNDADYVQVPNGTVVSFYQQFFLPYGDNTGSISVMADDSAALYLNDTLLVPEAPIAGNTYRICSDFPIGCLAGTVGIITLPSDLLVQGLNTLRFDVAQRAAVAYGLDYAGQITSTPEPSSSFLLFLGGATLLFAGGFGSLKGRVRDVLCKHSGGTHGSVS